MPGSPGSTLVRANAAMTDAAIAAVAATGRPRTLLGFLVVLALVWRTTGSNAANIYISIVTALLVFLDAIAGARRDASRAADAEQARLRDQALHEKLNGVVIATPGAPDALAGLENAGPDAINHAAIARAHEDLGC